ncbi:MAG: hypothetical protein QGH60_25030, partial [Phycisphaerae bacterium]|nr:hypothetical protein [Phycisphaerae bacterium]
RISLLYLFNLFNPFNLRCSVNGKGIRGGGQMDKATRCNTQMGQDCSGIQQAPWEAKRSPLSGYLVH